MIGEENGEPIVQEVKNDFIPKTFFWMFLGLLYLFFWAIY